MRLVVWRSSARVDFSKHIEKAEEAMRRRNYDYAVEVYHQLLEIDPDQGEARAGLRRALKKRFEAKKGSRFLRAIGGAMPLASAKALRKARKHDACAKALESYLGTQPLDAEANLMLGMSLEDAGHYKSARAVYEFVAEIAPKNPDGLKRAGAMMYRTGDHAKALEYYERALQADPRDQEALKARKDLAAETALTSGGYENVGHSRERIVDKEGKRLRYIYSPVGGREDVGIRISERVIDSLYETFGDATLSALGRVDAGRMDTQ